jgi:hypothetical protein
VTYTRGCIDTIDSPDDEHKVARNMWRIKHIHRRRILPQFGHLPRSKKCSAKILRVATTICGAKFLKCVAQIWDIDFVFAF